MVTIPILFPESEKFNQPDSAGVTLPYVGGDGFVRAARIAGARRAKQGGGCGQDEAAAVEKAFGWMPHFLKL